VLETRLLAIAASALFRAVGAGSVFVGLMISFGSSGLVNEARAAS